MRHTIKRTTTGYEYRRFKISSRNVTKHKKLWLATDEDGVQLPETETLWELRIAIDTYRHINNEK